MKDYAAIALDVRCDVCNAPPGLGCLRRDGTGQTEPHPSRVNEARLAAIGQPKRPDAAWLELAAIWRDASEADRAAVVAVVKARMALPMPPSTAALARAPAMNAFLPAGRCVAIRDSTRSGFRRREASEPRAAPPPQQ